MVVSSAIQWTFGLQCNRAMNIQNPERTIDRAAIQLALEPGEGGTLRSLLASLRLDVQARRRIEAQAVRWVSAIREDDEAGMMEVFLAEYGLSTHEGVALMCLAEALLRVSDAETIDELIEDKIAASAWAEHLGRSSSPLVNASTWALMLTGSVLTAESDGVVGVLRSAVRRLGEPVIRTAVGHAMRELGAQFVLGRDIDEAMERASVDEADGYTYSYDMLGEGARTESDAFHYHLAYAGAILALAQRCTSGNVADNPGISVKLSALHPRYEVAQRERVMKELVPRTLSLALLARSAGMGFNIDAEEADRLDLSLAVIEAVASDPSLAGWHGFGIVVQAYGRRASAVIDWLYTLAGTVGNRLMVRLVKGAYWDTEIKRTQVEGLAAYPVFTRKAATDVSYIACARKLLEYRDRLYPQFATHNAHTVAAVLEMAKSNEVIGNGANVDGVKGADGNVTHSTGAGRNGPDNSRDFEFQRLHGMGEALHERARKDTGHRCRIYAPVGAHRDLLAYLVRRLLENGANSSFVSQIMNVDVPPADVVADPVAAVESMLESSAQVRPALPLPADLFAGQIPKDGTSTMSPTFNVMTPDARHGGFINGQQRLWLLVTITNLNPSPLPIRRYRATVSAPWPSPTRT
jgi:RHH-type proline utilization regulon transcriptional repressor/proline dehydrogenase/delta 1-pyrroline-5-carboxylate dehydrogenase